MVNDSEGLNRLLLEAVPRSKKALELGCSTGRLGQRYKELHRSARWHGVDIDAPSLEVASKRLDRVSLADLDSVDVATFGGGYDGVVAGEVLEYLKAPEGPKVLSRAPAGFASRGRPRSGRFRPTR